MTLFHGSNADFDKVSLDFAKDRRDFGRGFYTTTIREQAADWAGIICRRHKTKTAYLYTFEFSAVDLTVKTFGAISRDWLDFIIENRIRGGTQHAFDIVTGPVANDRTMDTIGFFLAGIYSVEEALRRLEYMEPNDQLSLHTAKAIANLRFIRKDKWNV
ncbi:MAG: DUF3990 domain-containing protein [Spirochaetales bacterium]|jgi:hypothetical protein|nr:DUF3990 domain-containing protein [Spirochaetales bacterium]